MGRLSLLIFIVLFKIAEDEYIDVARELRTITIDKSQGRGLGIQVSYQKVHKPLLKFIHQGGFK